MSRNNVFVIEIVSSRSDGLVSLPKKFTENNLSQLGGINPALHRMFYPVEIFTMEAQEKAKAAVASGSEANASSASLSPQGSPNVPTAPQSPTSLSRIASLGFAAATLLRPSTNDAKIQVGPQFAKDFGLADGELVTVSPALYQRQWKVATRVEIIPLNANESEVIEKNAYALQNSLMQYLRVVFPGQTVTLRTNAGVQASVTVSSQYLDPPGASAYVLADGTELLVAVKARQKTDLSSGKENTNKTKPRASSLLRLLPSHIIDRIARESIKHQDGTATKTTLERDTQLLLSYSSMVFHTEVEFNNKTMMNQERGGRGASPLASARGVIYVHPRTLAANNWEEQASTDNGGGGGGKGMLVVGAFNVSEMAWTRPKKIHGERGGTARNSAYANHLSDQEDEGGEDTSHAAFSSAGTRENTAAASSAIITSSFVRKHGTTFLVRPMPASPFFPSASASETFFALLPENAALIVDWSSSSEPSTSSSVRMLTPDFTPTSIFTKIAPEAQYSSNSARVLLPAHCSDELMAEESYMRQFEGDNKSTSSKKVPKSNASSPLSLAGMHSRTDFLAAHPIVKHLSLDDVGKVHGEALSHTLASLWEPHAQTIYERVDDDQHRQTVSTEKVDTESETGEKETSKTETLSNKLLLCGLDDLAARRHRNTGMALCSGNTLLVGPKGCGKSTIAAVAAFNSSRHVISVDCAASVTPELMEGVIAELNLCSPSLLLLDNFDALASSASANGAGGPPTSITPATDLMIQGWLLRNSRLAGADIIVVATAASFEELQPSLKLPMCFPRVLKIPPALSHDKKAELMRQLLRPAFFPRSNRSGDQTQASSQSVANNENEVSNESARVRAANQSHALELLVETLGKMVENFSAGDLSGLITKIERWYKLTVRPTIPDFAFVTREELADKISHATVGHVASSFVPSSQVGIRFLGAGKDSSKTRPPSWDDAGGLEEAKAALHDVLVLPLKFPKLFAKLPLKTKSGVLLHGPSGCGKTYLLSVAVAAEGLHCIVVNGPEIFGKYIGTSEQKIREIFESAQAAAPCVVFFDEFDSVAPRRGNSNTGVTDRVVNQLLCYLDGVEGRKDVYVVAATSRPDLIDPALLRPGRLDRQVKCPMPNHADRKGIFVAHLRKTIPLAAEDQTLAVGDEDLDELAKVTEGYTSADIAGLVSSANSQVIQSYFKLSGDVLLAQLADGGGVTSNAGNDKKDKQTNKESDSVYEVLPAPCVAEDTAAETATVKKITESLLRNESIAALVATASGNAASIMSGQTMASASSDFPKVRKQDILLAMEKFSRSRESQKKGQEAAEGDIAAKLKELKKVMGTRQTSA